MIDQDFLNDCRKSQRELVLDLSRDIIVGYGNSIEEDCPNCTYDGVSGSSGSFFTSFSGTVVVLSGTSYQRVLTAKAFKQRCPLCGGKGFFSAPNEKMIKAHVYWSSKDQRNSYPSSPAGYSKQNIVKLKTDSRYSSDFNGAKYFVVDGVRVEPSTTPIIRSIQSTDGIVEIFCETVL